MQIDLTLTNHPAAVAGRRLALDLRRQLSDAHALVDKTGWAIRLSGGGPQVGQKVSVKDDEVQKPEQLGVVFTIVQVVGVGADAFVSLRAPDGTIAEWFRADEIQPAVAHAVAPPPKALAPRAYAAVGEPPAPGRPLQAADAPAQKLITLAHTLAKQRRISYRNALILASELDPVSADRYRARFGSVAAR